MCEWVIKPAIHFRCLFMSKQKKANLPPIVGMHSCMQSVHMDMSYGTVTFPVSLPEQEEARWHQTGHKENNRILCNQSVVLAKELSEQPQECISSYASMWVNPRSNGSSGSHTNTISKSWESGHFIKQASHVFCVFVYSCPLRKFFWGFISRC